MSPATDLAPLALQFVSSLAVVLGILAALLYGIRRLSRRGMTTGPGAPIRILASRPLGVKKSICMVQVPGRILVLGLAGDSIRKLTELDDAEALGSLAAPEPSDGPAPSFRSRLNRIAAAFSPENARANAETR